MNVIVGSCLSCKHYLGCDDSTLFPRYMCDIPREKMPANYNIEKGCIMWEFNGIGSVNKRYKGE